MRVCGGRTTGRLASYFVKGFHFVQNLLLPRGSCFSFLHNEVPGMQVPPAVMKALKAAPSREAQRAVGMEVAREALLEVKSHPRVRGVYVYPPFGSYRAVLRVLDGIIEPPEDADTIPPSTFEQKMAEARARQASPPN